MPIKSTTVEDHGDRNCLNDLCCAGACAHNHGLLLDEKLRKHEDAPLAYTVKGNPDGSGRYLYRAYGLRNTQKGRWIEPTLNTVIDWVRNARKLLEVVLVDVGGSREPRAQEGNLRLFRECSHYLALARELDEHGNELEESKRMAAWALDAEHAGLKRLAQVRSVIKGGEPFFDAASRTGLFRGDAARYGDTLNDPLVDGLTESLIKLRVKREAPEYIDLRRGYWQDVHLQDLSGGLDRLRTTVRESGKAFLGGVAPIFAYAAAFHRVLDERPDASI